MTGGELPEKLRNYLGDRVCELDETGRSSATVMKFSDCVLKISETTPDSVNEWQVMERLYGSLCVPEVLCRVSEQGREFVLMSRLEGVMSCDGGYLDRLPALVDGLAEGLKTLWNTPIPAGMADFSLDFELDQAQQRLDTIDWAWRDRELRERFPEAADLLRWLREHKPKEEPVLSHGDYCLPNVFLSADYGGRLTGLLDLGHCGTADRYRDISLCLKSLKNNLAGVFGGPVREGYDPAMLFDALGMECDREKLEYYLLLDELW